MSLVDLSSIYQETYQTLADFIGDNGYAPSTKELCGLLGLSSTSSVHERLQVLEGAGLIERMGPRAIRVIGGPQ